MAPLGRTTTPVTSVPVGLTRKQPLFMRSGPLPNNPLQALDVNQKIDPNLNLFPCSNPGAPLPKRITISASTSQAPRKDPTERALTSRTQESIAANPGTSVHSRPKFRGDWARALGGARSLRPGRACPGVPHPAPPLPGRSDLDPTRARQPRPGTDPTRSTLASHRASWPLQRRRASSSRLSWPWGSR
jgi:hypothetical protein